MAQPSDERPPPALVRRYDVERSCVRCHERKVRCDKATPCSMCVRARVPCRYPGPERMKRRSQRLSTARVGPRLEMLGRGVATINEKECLEINTCEHDLSKSEGPTLGAADVTDRADRSVTPTNGLLVKEGASARYINESLLSRVLEKECDLQSAIDAPANPTDRGDQTQGTDGFDGLLSNPLLTKQISNLHPSRWQAAQLWQVYLNNVDALLKLLHVPTTQPLVFAAINSPGQAPANHTALLFAVYFAAVTSLSSPGTQVILGEDRQSALCKYQRGLEVSLHAASFLDSPTIISLQAISIYLLCRRNHSGGRSRWVLNGLVIRAAQSIGLHRDGGQFHLGALDCEIRRRLWWAIQGFDTRVAEDHGFSTNTDDLRISGDTELPLNVDDRDLDPEMNEAPACRPAWTEMTMFLVTVEMNQAMRRISQECTAMPTRPASERMAWLEQLVETVKTRLHARYLQYCDANIPIQKSALLLGRVCLGKLEVFVRQQDPRGLSAEGSNSTVPIADQTLALACDTIEIGNELKTDELLSNFRWLFCTYTQYHLLTYSLWHLCIRPQTPSAERAWAVVNTSFGLVESWPSPGRKWNVLRKLREKALQIRSACCLPPTQMSHELAMPEPLAGMIGDHDAADLFGGMTEGFFDDEILSYLDPVLLPGLGSGGLPRSL
ncbi:putative C6 transcription factor [Aspergillus ibericus CBS 121593]|uniref:Putative C6 transcription factor n=1 Tax=Aspergillus ibericus CBS 121593 TaxID=1448316 RepID=A0A395H6Y2_9EURO|nr:putative C6 transcription factor [Aspergillus ibericus CBS 121593]RAL03682.1 putative C6 transcription factor [Aspergillus ibericus CBS 121593]